MQFIPRPYEAIQFTSTGDDDNREDVIAWLNDFASEYNPDSMKAYRTLLRFTIGNEIESICDTDWIVRKPSGDIVCVTDIVFRGWFLGME